MKKRIKKNNKMPLVIGVGSIMLGVGFYYMGKSNILKKLSETGLATLSVINGKVKAMITEKAKGVSNSSKMFDYNNPNLHSSDNYWLENSTGNFKLPILNSDGSDTGKTIDVNVSNDGEIKPSIWQSVLSAFGI